MVTEQLQGIELVHVLHSNTLDHLRRLIEGEFPHPGGLKGGGFFSGHVLKGKGKRRHVQRTTS